MEAVGHKLETENTGLPSFPPLKIILCDLEWDRLELYKNFLHGIKVVIVLLHLF